jgi:hypothetical protein
MKLSELSDEDLLLVGVHARVLVQYPGHLPRILFTQQQQNRKNYKTIRHLNH